MATDAESPARQPAANAAGWQHALAGAGDEP